MNKNLKPTYAKTVSQVRETGLASKQSIMSNFSYLSYSEAIEIHKRLQLDGIITSNPDGWLCEVMR